LGSLNGSTFRGKTFGDSAHSLEAAISEAATSEKKFSSWIYHRSPWANWAVNEVMRFNRLWQGRQVWINPYLWLSLKKSEQAERWQSFWKLMWRHIYFTKL
jgi:hypothetical protein